VRSVEAMTTINEKMRSRKARSYAHTPWDISDEIYRNHLHHVMARSTYILGWLAQRTSVTKAAKARREKQSAGGTTLASALLPLEELAGQARAKPGPAAKARILPGLKPFCDTHRATTVGEGCPKWTTHRPQVANMSSCFAPGTRSRPDG